VCQLLLLGRGVLDLDLTFHCGKNFQAGWSVEKYKLDSFDNYLTSFSEHLLEWAQLRWLGKRDLNHQCAKFCSIFSGHGFVEEQEETSRSARSNVAWQRCGVLYVYLQKNCESF
jgi:hypothetical protein